VGEALAKRPLDVDMVLLFGYGSRLIGVGDEMGGLQGRPRAGRHPKVRKDDAWFWEPRDVEQPVAEGRTLRPENKRKVNEQGRNARQYNGGRKWI